MSIVLQGEATMKLSVFHYTLGNLKTINSSHPTTTNKMLMQQKTRMKITCGVNLSPCAIRALRTNSQISDEAMLAKVGDEFNSPGSDTSIRPWRHFDGKLPDSDRNQKDQHRFDELKWTNSKKLQPGSSICETILFLFPWQISTGCLANGKKCILPKKLIYFFQENTFTQQKK